MTDHKSLLQWMRTSSVLDAEAELQAFEAEEAEREKKAKEAREVRMKELREKVERQREKKRRQQEEDERQRKEEERRRKEKEDRRRKEEEDRRRQEEKQQEEECRKKKDDDRKREEKKQEEKTRQEEERKQAKSKDKARAAPEPSSDDEEQERAPKRLKPIMDAGVSRPKMGGLNMCWRCKKSRVRCKVSEIEARRACQRCDYGHISCSFIEIKGPTRKSRNREASAGGADEVLSQEVLILLRALMDGQGRIIDRLERIHARMKEICQGGGAKSWASEKVDEVQEPEANGSDELEEEASGSDELDEEGEEEGSEGDSKVVDKYLRRLPAAEGWME